MQQEGAAAQLLPLLPPFFADLTLSAQGSPLKDGRWGLQGAHLAWQVCCKARWSLSWAIRCVHPGAIDTPVSTCRCLWQSYRMHAAHFL